MVLLYCGRVGRRREFYTRKKPVRKTGFRVLWPFFTAAPMQAGSATKRTERILHKPLPGLPSFPYLLPTDY